MIVKNTLRNIRRSPYQTFSAFLIMVITFFMVSIFVMLAFFSQAILNHFETKPQVSAFYPNDTPEEEILAVKARLEETGLAKDVHYISSEEAVEIYKKDIASDDIDANLDLISDKVLPPSLEVTAWNLDNLRSLKTILEEKEGVNVVFIEEVVDKLGSWVSGLRLGGVALLALLFIESVLVIWTIIAMRISQRAQEIEVMRLLGATGWYIRAPFIFEGILYGIVGAFIGVLMTYVLLLSSEAGLASFLSGIPQLPLTPQSFFAVLSGSNTIDGIPITPISPLFIVVLFVIEAVMGALVGALGSSMSVLRNLRRA